MRKDAIKLEEGRVADANHPENFPPFKERHRLFPAVFENRQHRKVLDLAAGVGYITQRLLDSYPAQVLCHDLDPSCLQILRKTGAPTMCFDLDNADTGFPLSSGAFDAVISMVTIEHLLFVDEFIDEIRRILTPAGYLYISTPNYAAPEYLTEPLLFGRSFHDPMSQPSKYEFYAHVRYFTYRTLVELVTSRGFTLEAVYIAAPAGSARYQDLRSQSKLKALTYRSAMWLRHRLLPAGWASEPVLCFRRSETAEIGQARKVVL